MPDRFPDEKQQIDLQTWERRSRFDFFKNSANGRHVAEFVDLFQKLLDAPVQHSV
jgi:chloramphenicol O-acetyltransferase